MTDPVRLQHGPAWPNRYALAPLTNKQSNADGTLSDDEYEWLVARGRGGFGMVMTCAAYVHPTGKAWAGQLGIASDDQLAGLTWLAAGLRETGTVSAVQLHHGGFRADPELAGELVAPWQDEKHGARALTTGEVESMINAFIDAGVRAKRAGFDGAQVHGAHGYLLAQFLDRRNVRTDGYGGDLDGRMRPMVDIINGIRKATGDDFQVGVRLSPEASGTPLTEGKEVARRLLALGVLDHVDMSLWDVRAKARYGEPGDDRMLIEHFVDLPRHGARLGVAGLIDSAAEAQWCVDQGADFVSVGIGAILHHDFPTRALADPAFRVRERPVSAAVLASESVGPDFVDYLRSGWKEFVN